MNIFTPPRLVLVACFATALALSACAKPTWLIDPEKVPMGYVDKMSCSQLESEFKKVNRDFKRVRKQQRTAATVDFVVAPLVSKVLDADKEEEFAELKYKVQYIKDKLSDKNCK